MYARKLTKDELKKSGIIEVTEDCRVFTKNSELKPFTNNQGYYMVNIFELDEDGNKITVPYEKSVFGCVYKTRSVGLHRLMWAWHSEEEMVPDGFVVDHINNEHDKLEDYYMSNLQLLTPAENLAKDRNNWHVWELKCQLNKPRSFYEDKLKGFEVAYEDAKKRKDADAAHRFRNGISQTRARLRYYDSHIEETRAIQLIKEQEEARKKACHARAERRRELQARIDKARKYYNEALEAYGKDDEYVQKLKGEWKLAIAMLSCFKAECKKDKEKIS